MIQNGLFKGFLMGGFECSTHRAHTGRRVDVIAATRHDEFAEADYERLLQVGMRSARDGVRWHLIETEPYRYDFSSALSQIRAARKTGMQIIWDLFHYGYPDDLDIFSPEFPARFAAFAKAFTELLTSENSEMPFLCPVNEISFFSWIAGKVGGFYPFARRRDEELKEQLVRATLAGIDAIRTACPAARFVQTDPAINVLPRNSKPHTIRAAKIYQESQFHAFDMIIGTRKPELGGAPEYLDIIGLNYYFNNQWWHPRGQRIFRADKNYLPFSQILRAYAARYERPILIAETGIEDEARPEWFRYIFEQARIARANGVKLEGLCLYPIINHPGWDDDRHCQNGLWSYPNDAGRREIYAPLAEEIKLQMNYTDAARFAAHGF